MMASNIFPDLLHRPVFIAFNDLIIEVLFFLGGDNQITIMSSIIVLTL